MRDQADIERMIAERIGETLQAWGFRKTSRLLWERDKGDHTDQIRMGFRPSHPTRLSVGVAVSYPHVESAYRAGTGVRTAPAVAGCGIHLLREPYDYREWDFGDRSLDAAHCAEILAELTFAEHTFFPHCDSLDGVRQLHEHHSPWTIGSLEHCACMLACILHVSREPARATAVLQAALDSLKTARPASRELVCSMRDYLRSRA